MKNPLVSVVIPTFDRPEFLERAIRGVMKQDYRPIEVIVVVDGVSEGSRALVESLGNETDLTLRLIETQEKVGGSEARNIGAREAKGTFTALLDDDDEWFEDKLSSQLRLIREKGMEEKDDFLCFTSLLRYKHKEQEKYDKLPNTDYVDSGKASIADYLFETKGLRNVGFIQTSTVLVPTRLLLQTPFTKGLPKHQDWDWLLKLDKEHQLTVLQVEEPKIIYHSDVPKTQRTGYINRWRFTETWGESHRDAFSKQGYESFLLNYVMLGISSDQSMTIKERKAEIKKRFKQLSLKGKLRPYTWKMIVYFQRSFNQQ